MIPPLTPSVSWTERYETLRSHVLNGDRVFASKPLSLVLWLAQGMAGWMREWTKVVDVAPPPAVVPPPRQFIVHRFIEMGTHHNGTSNVSNFRHRCTTGAPLISAIPFRMRSFNSSQEATRIPRRKVRAIFPNRVSTKFSHEPWVGVCT